MVQLNFHKHLIDESGKMVNLFTDYAELLLQSFPKVKNWITFNEPYVFCFLGYSSGVHAPGLRRKNYLQCGHNVILANTKVYRLFKEGSQRKAFKKIIFLHIFIRKIIPWKKLKNFQ